MDETLDSLQLIKRSIAGQWLVTPKARAAVIAGLEQMASDATLPPRARIAASRVLVAASKVNLEVQRHELEIEAMSRLSALEERLDVRDKSACS